MNQGGLWLMVKVRDSEVADAHFDQVLIENLGPQVDSEGWDDENQLLRRFVFQVFVSYNLPDDVLLTPLVIEKLVEEIKNNPDKF